MKNIIKKYWGYLLAITITIIIAATLFPYFRQRTPSISLDKIPEYIYVWDEITKEDEEEAGYGLYTYVLFGRRTDNLDVLDPATRDRYLRILNAIIDPDHSTGDTDTGREKKGLRNIFYLPSQHYIKATGLRPKAQYYAREIYDSDLSMSCLALLKRALEDPELRQRITVNPGPFLVSTQQPIVRHRDKPFPGNSNSYRKTTAEMLYADLSGTNPVTLKDIVSSYRDYVIKQNRDAEEKLKELRETLLNFITNDNLRIVRIAM